MQCREEEVGSRSMKTGESVNVARWAMGAKKKSETNIAVEQPGRQPVSGYSAKFSSINLV
jgi:hypothetical protein